MNTDLARAVSRLGEAALAEMGEGLGLSAQQTRRAAGSLAETFTGDRGEAVRAAVKETGIGAKQIESLLDKLIEASAEPMPMASKGLFSRLLGRI